MEADDRSTHLEEPKASNRESFFRARTSEHGTSPSLSRRRHVGALRAARRRAAPCRRTRLSFATAIRIRPASSRRAAPDARSEGERLRARAPFSDTISQPASRVRTRLSGAHFALRPGRRPLALGAHDGEGLTTHFDISGRTPSPRQPHDEIRLLHGISAARRGLSHADLVQTPMLSAPPRHRNGVARGCTCIATQCVTVCAASRSSPVRTSPMQTRCSRSASRSSGVRLS